MATVGEWAGLSAIGMVRFRVTIGETEAVETSCAIASPKDILASTAAMRNRKIEIKKR